MKLIRLMVLPVVTRVARRDPGVALGLAVWRWWRRKSARRQRHVVHIGRNEAVTIERRERPA
jgi:hypothetical protein